MINVIIVLILALICVITIRSSIKHFKGEGGCCGGSGGIIENKKDLSEPELGSKNISISGMTCENCRIRVQNALNSIDGLSANVNLKKGTATLHYSKEISEDEIRTCIENAGYGLQEVR